jgi:ribosomal protein S27E
MTIRCPKCDVENELDYSAGDETLVCEGCDALLMVNEDGSVSEI